MMKIRQFQEKLKENKVDAAIILNFDSMGQNPNLQYFTQYSGVGALIIPKTRTPFLIAPKMEVQRAKKGLIKKVYAMDKKRFFEYVKGIMKKQRISPKTIGIDQSSINVNLYKALRKNLKAKTKDISMDLLRLRETKTAKELKIIKKAFSYSNGILKKTIKNLKDFKTESQVAAYLEYESKKLGLGMSFPPIVASGKNAAMPHYEPKNVRLNKGLCVIDYGITYKGYCTDITRTVGIKSVKKEEKKAYNVLLDVQESLIKNIRIGNKCSKIYESCVSDLGKYAKYFTHGLGHGVGVEIHELPNLTPNSKDIIQKNSPFTVEPGIYIPNRFGIRIEDTVVIESRLNTLTKVPKDLLIV